MCIWPFWWRCRLCRWPCNGDAFGGGPNTVLNDCGEAHFSVRGAIAKLTLQDSGESADTLYYNLREVKHIFVAMPIGIWPC